MLLEKFRERLVGTYLADAILFDQSAYDKSIIGFDTKGRAIYDYDKMVEELMEDQGWSYDEAREWIEYNTLDSLPDRERYPIVMITKREDIDEG